MHLGEFASPARPVSSHSMRTIPRHPGKSPLGPSHESEEEGWETAKYGTVGTYRTAREAGSEERDEGAITRGSRLKGGRKALGDIWDHDGDDGMREEVCLLATREVGREADQTPVEAARQRAQGPRVVHGPLYAQARRSARRGSQPGVGLLLALVQPSPLDYVPGVFRFCFLFSCSVYIPAPSFVGPSRNHTPPLHSFC